MATLEKLHAKHVLPGFNDRSKEEREIEGMTADITRVSVRGLIAWNPANCLRLSGGMQFDILDRGGRNLIGLVTSPAAEMHYPVKPVPHRSHSLNSILSRNNRTSVVLTPS